MKKILFWILSCIIAILIPIYLLFHIYPQKIMRIEGNDYVLCNDLIWGEFSHKLDKTTYSFEGWVVYPGIQQGYAVLDNKSVWLYETDTEVFYKLKSQQSSKRDKTISEKINDGIDYQSSIFSVSVDLGNLNLSQNVFDIYICYQHGGNNYLVKTNMSIDKGILINNEV